MLANLLTKKLSLCSLKSCKLFFLLSLCVVYTWFVPFLFGKEYEHNTEPAS